ncbi:hypothetical protein K493DRAFT_404476 [Basidiobolus meristosporus CBS 931.73]|uniref:SH3 domain-containing protein n=1 Tax=Basidiobolus meristosporus CBS 931.73 TaxID=1314790 RepID=A0A1Y1Z5Q5_9FUNG|nr:hypothetical protein K493DRAFT_404476 [Basidiobolus meristosporus CBS 931.73]|eukprot:ORY05135.1 hypothetical protein K493DRAFT_404476 [Basidiobolus meristosporus CBS 931.73]
MTKSQPGGNPTASNSLDQNLVKSDALELRDDLEVTEPSHRHKVDTSSTSGEAIGLKIRDFAFKDTDPRHWGEKGEDTDAASQGLSKAIALYDFEAENPSELSFMQDDILTIQQKQCAGWLVGFKVEDKVGLIPESFVRIIN